ncbi:hypothetical protein C0993_000899 [Termitomyces sp. T159_Od127]|nr:hypothetical protein C0993_000899 [Termitomyces sp. T159_Od127]
MLSESGGKQSGKQSVKREKLAEGRYSKEKVGLKEIKEQMKKPCAPGIQEPNPPGKRSTKLSSSYFMLEGREEAARSESFASQEIVTLAKDDDVLALKPVVNFKAKGKVIQDEDLTWEQSCIPSTNFPRSDREVAGEHYRTDALAVLPPHQPQTA